MTPADWTDALRSLLPDDYVPEPEAPTPKPELPKPVLSISLDKKRAGKTATIISGFDPDDPRQHELAAELKKQLATGGSARGGEILVQGDRTRQVADFLRAKGYKVKGH